MKTQRSLLISPFLTPCIFLSTSDCTDDSQQPEVQTLSCVLNYSWIFLFGSSVCTFAFICSPESWVYWSISHSQLWTTRWDRMKWTSSVRLLFKAGVWTRNMLIVFIHSRMHLAAGIVKFQTKCLKLLFLWCLFCTILYPSGCPIISNWGWSWWLFSFLQALNGLFGVLQQTQSVHFQWQMMLLHYGIWEKSTHLSVRVSPDCSDTQ